MARPRAVRSLTRPHRLLVSVDTQTADDLDRIGADWGMPAVTVVYWLVRGVLSDLRGEGLDMIGDPVSERAGRWLVARHRDSTPTR